MAGESARESARRQREKAERLQRSAELWERGAEGEQRTADVLTQLPAESWTVFHDLRWPGRRFANVDHVVVGPPGMFVIDSKNWSGSITIKGDVLRQNSYKRETAVAGTAEAAVAVGQLVPLLRPELVRPVMCFVREEQVTGWARNVMITSTTTLVPMLVSRPAVLAQEEVRHLCLDLDASIRQATGTPAAPPARPRRPPTPSAGGPLQPRRSRSAASTSSRGRTPYGLVGSLLAASMLLGFAFIPGLREPVTDRITELIVPPASQEEDPAKERKKRNGNNNREPR